LVWQAARELLKFTYKITSVFPPEEKFNLLKHMRECARNIPANIAEGFGRFHYQESMQFYRIARGSLMELKSDYYSALDIEYINKNDFETSISLIDKVGSLLNGFIRNTIKYKNISSN